MASVECISDFFILFIRIYNYCDSMNINFHYVDTQDEGILVNVKRRAMDSTFADQTIFDK